MSHDILLTFNAGSSTVKIGVFAIQGASAVRLGKGTIDFRKKPLGFRVSEGSETVDVELTARSDENLSAVLSETFAWLAKRYDMTRVVAIGHRVVHGGDLFSGPTVLDDAAITAIEELTPLAPLHQPQSLRLIYAVRHVREDLLQTASFDTAFHRTNPEVVTRFALPRALYDAGVKRYGFHGLSYKHIASALQAQSPELAEGRVIAAHLGSGASLCAMAGGVSRDSSMGFSTLDGIPMATRCGALDPGVLLYLLAAGKSPAEIEHMLYHQSGLLGVSGISADSRTLLADQRPEAREAIDLFTFRAAGEIARLTATLGGLDTIVFTAGVGENQPEIREGICKWLAWLGVELAPDANAANASRIDSPTSRVTVCIIPADEEQVIADETLSILNRSD